MTDHLGPLPQPGTEAQVLHHPDHTVSKTLGECRWRDRVRVQGRVRALRVQPWEGGVATLECTLVDESGGLTVIFQGRQRIAGVRLGAHLEVEGTVIESRNQLAIMNPAYTLLPDPPG